MNNHIEYYNLKKFINRKAIEIYIIVLGSLVLIYLLISLYFVNHFFLNTVINNVNVSLKSYQDGEELLKIYPTNYELLLIEREGTTEKLNGVDIKYKFNENNRLHIIHSAQQSFKWVFSLFKDRNYYVKDLYSFDRKILRDRIEYLRCLQGDKILPENVRFQYLEGSYQTIKEVKGNMINIDKLETAICQSLLKGEPKLDLDKKDCYDNPRYTLISSKTAQSKQLLNRYASTSVTYKFGDVSEVLDGNIINQWLTVDNNLDVEINVRFVRKYIQSLSKKYDTVGIKRNFKTSLGKVVVVNGGLYGFKINQDAEVLALIDHICQGENIEKEPVYTQRAFARGENEIGNTYVEINITRQYLWFYKEGKLLAQGAVVTGNPNKGNATVIGTNMLNYKQKGVSLTGPGYEVGVTYWMPFYGNIGIHDATWRHSFGGTIYKRSGSHGCVNAPKYLAKIIYENIKDGIPIISYEEPQK
ncbi:MAG: hypothetical protein K0S61_2612 [Anaerocolumna sp.]|jgi:hypothetical protein|nr:hypothetical protein [Anaerocolumna sp.]